MRKGFGTVLLVWAIAEGIYSLGKKHGYEKHDREVKDLLLKHLVVKLEKEAEKDSKES